MYEELSAVSTYVVLKKKDGNFFDNVQYVYVDDGMFLEYWELPEFHPEILQLRNG